MGTLPLAVIGGGDVDALQLLLAVAMEGLWSQYYQLS